MTDVLDDKLERATRAIATAHGCDRGTFTVCWGEYERGEICRCKEEARAQIGLAPPEGQSE